jgi:hypothetical protein
LVLFFGTDSARGRLVPVDGNFKSAFTSSVN